MEKENRKAAYINACQKRSTPKEILKQVQDDMVRHDADARMRRIVQGMTGRAGRSMVEMLGVLAIIGILSAGALKGYSNAMFKYKMNQTIDIFQGVLQRFTELEEKGIGTYIGQSDFVKYGFLEECRDDEYGCRLPIGVLVADLNDTGTFMYGSIGVHFTDSKSCIAFSSVDWGRSSPIEWFAKPEEYGGGSIYVSSGGSSEEGTVILYDAFGNRGDPITETTMSIITQACKGCDEYEYGCMYWFNIRGEM